MKSNSKFLIIFYFLFFFFVLYNINFLWYVLYFNFRSDEPENFVYDTPTLSEDELSETFTIYYGTQGIYN